MIFKQTQSRWKNRPAKRWARVAMHCGCGIASILLVILVQVRLVVGQENAKTSSETIPFPSAKPFAEWLESRGESLSAARPTKERELLESLTAMLRQPRDGRERLLMPRARTTPAARRLSPAWEVLFSNSDDRNTYAQYLSRLQSEVEASIRDAEIRKDLESSYRLRWFAAGIASLKMPQSAVNWGPAEALLGLTRVGGKPKGPHPVTGWPASAYQWVQTQNFDIAIQGKGNEAQDIAELCELTFAVWSLLFQNYWHKDPDEGSFGERSSDIPSPSPGEPFQVIVFRNKESYNRALEKEVPNVSVSTGYYSSEAKVSFLIVDPKRTYETLVHELTHQFFMEASSEPVHFDFDRSHGFWGVEGAAMFLESLSIRELGGARLIDIGGWDSPRLQASRFRLLHDRFWFPWDEFGSADGTRFRDPRDIAARYSQACGLAHYWMESSTKNRMQFVKHLKALYLNGTSEVLEETDESLMTAYIEYLRSGHARDPNYLPFANRKELVLSRCPLEPIWFRELLAKKPVWESLDVSYTELDGDFWPADQMGLEILRLNLESTRISDGIMSSLGEIQRLQELDLSNCRISSAGIDNLANHPTLKTLWIVGTDVDDDAIESILSMPKLQTLHAQGCKISEKGWEDLLRRNAKLRRDSAPP